MANEVISQIRIGEKVYDIKDNSVSGQITSAASSTTPKAPGIAAVGSETKFARGDHVHPLQTSVSGNAGTATKLVTARTIRTNLSYTNTASFDGSANVAPGVTGTLPIANGGTGATNIQTARSNLGFGPFTTSGNGSAYTVNIPGITSLYEGLTFTLIFHVENNASPTLNVNGLGACSLCFRVNNGIAGYFAGLPAKKIQKNIAVDIMYSRGIFLIEYFQVDLGLDVTGVVTVSNGGTGASNAASARENLGAAPAGYGLGENVVRITDVSQLDNYSENGWYRCKFSSVVGLNNIWFMEANLEVTKTGDDNWTQKLWVAGHASPIVRVCQPGWKDEWESDNPPMVPGLEYRTTERFNNSPVYVKALDIGALPNGTLLSVAHGVPATQIIKCSGITSDGTYLPYFVGSNYLHIAATCSHIYIFTANNWSNYTGIVQIWYTKD